MTIMGENTRGTEARKRESAVRPCGHKAIWRLRDAISKAAIGNDAGGDSQREARTGRTVDA